MPKTNPEQLLRRLFPPMLATLTDTPPSDDENWSWELKYDGFRALVAITGGGLAMWSRNELDLEPRFPHIGAALRKLRLPDLVLDGEIVALDEHGAPRFQLLQQGEQREKLFVFDILWLDGKDVRKLPYEQRRELLEKALRRTPPQIAVAKRLEESGAEALALAAAGGWEGVIAKRRTSTYEPRRSKEWLKLKAINRQELMVIGWQPSTHSDREIGSLHLGYNGSDGRIHYAGKVGTGFSDKQRVWFKQVLSKDGVPQSPASDAPRIRTATWVHPRLVVQVSFAEWTADNRLRHPSFLGIRDDKSPEEVVREKPSSPPGTSTKISTQPSEKSPKKKSEPRPSKKAAASPVVITHPERVLYPRDGITKQDVADYYAAVAGPMTRALRDRPLALEHWNQGIDHPSWFQQHIGREGPAWLTIVETPTRTTGGRLVKHLVADKPETLRWLAQMSVLSVHMWSSRADSLNEPDWLVFDLDPAKGEGIAQAIDAALVMRKVLEQLEIPSVPKTSGKRGMHVLVPLAPGYTHEAVADFACSVAAAVTSKVPGMTVERSLSQRRGRLYLDCMQNAYGKTIVAPYSPRAVDGAPVSAPLKWSEITRKLDPLKFNLRTMPKRLDKVGDLFAEVFATLARLPKLK